MTEDRRVVRIGTRKHAEDFSIFEPPKDVGHWQVSEGACFYLKSKPNFIIRFFTRLLLGWIWVDK